MTVAELLMMLEGLDPQTEVRMAYQPNYPLCAEVRGTKLVDENEEEREQAQAVIDDPDSSEDDYAEAHQALERLEAFPQVLYLVEGSHLGYASRSLWD